MERYDVAIIGGGQAGVPLAFELPKANKRTVLAERKHLGGSCVNFGCTPTKAVIASARLAHLARRAGEFGLRIPTVEADFSAVIQRARDIVSGQRSSIESGLAGKDNPRIITAQARLDGRDGARFRIRAGDEVIVADHVVLDTGTRSAIPPIEGIGDVDVMHAGNWLESTALPQRLIVIGGGVIALEMAQFYRRMGSQVVVIEALPQIASTEDPDVAEALQDLLEGEGIEFHLESKIERVEKRGDAVLVHIAGKGVIGGTDLFVAAGRKPNTDDLGLESVGVKTNRGIIDVDERLSTNVAGIWAAGDIRGGPMFTHTAWDDYRVLFSQIAGDQSRTTDRVVPYAIFTDPEIGRVGLNEAQARKSGKQIRVARFEIRRNSKSLEIGETNGFIKVIADASTGQLLGATVMCNEAAELVHIYIDLMNARAKVSVIRDAVYIHPTFAEAIQSAAELLK
jgi:pyruvate/2-oxoglutarate dehydrogenase complex dihydrolipoamide dehydrogenase (E3) component